jgi:pSer/pThr/pTyr-binding forkhead associated (FHA) protein
MTRLDFYDDDEFFHHVELGYNTVTLGRSRSCSVRLPDERVSRLHAIIRPSADGRGYELEDRGTNGTLVNGRRVHGPTPLRPGDRIDIEGFHIVHRNEDEPASLFELAIDSLGELVSPPAR